MAGGKDIKAGGAYVELFFKNSLTKPLFSAVKTVAVGLTAITGAAAGVGAAALAHFATAGSALADMSARTGLAASNLAELKFAAEQSGAGIEDVEAALKKMAKGGLDVSKFDQYAEAIAAIKDPSERAAKAQEIWGKSGTKLLPMLEDLQKLRGEARELGLAPSESDVAMADKLGDSFDKVKSVLSAGLFKLGAMLAPVIQPALESATKLIARFNEWALTNNFVVDTLKAIGNALSGGQLAVAGEIAVKSLQLAFLTGLDFIANAIGGTLGAALGDVGTRLIQGDLAGAWNTTVAGMAAMWATFSEGIVNVFTAAANAILDVFESLNKKLFEVYGTLAKSPLLPQSLRDFLSGLSMVGGIGANLPGQSITDPARDFLASLNETAKGSAAEASAAASGAAERKPNEEIAKLQAELAELRRRAAEGVTVEAKRKAQAEDGFGLDDKGKTAVGFSASALALQLSGGSQDKVVRGLEQIKKVNERQERLLEKIADTDDGFAIAA